MARDVYKGFNFLVEIDGITQAGFQECGGLDSTVAMIEYREGTDRPNHTRKLAGLTSFSAISLKRGITDSDELYQWHEDFVIKGNCTQDKERVGALHYLGSDLKELFTLEFSGLGIFSLTPEKHEAGSENIRRIKAEMYCEQISFAPGQGSVFA